MKKHFQWSCCHILVCLSSPLPILRMNTSKVPMYMLILVSFWLWEEKFVNVVDNKNAWEERVVLLEEQLNQHVNNVFDQPLQQFCCFVTSSHDDETSLLAQGWGSMMIMPYHSNSAQRHEQRNVDDNQIWALWMILQNDWANSNTLYDLKVNKI